MGQGPSSADSREDNGDDEIGDILCSGAGCLLAPRFFRRREVVIFENYSVAEEDPDDLVSTDVEDEDEDEFSDYSSDVTIRDLPNGGVWLPEYVAELVTTDEPPQAAPTFVPMGVEEGKEESRDSDDTAIPEDVLSKIVAVDCGMIFNKDGVNKQELRRVSVVDGYGNPLLSALVRVDPPPTGYISSMLPRERRVNDYGDDFDVGVSATKVREEVSNLLRGKVVVGHAVEGDLTALGLGLGRRSSVERKGRDFEVRDTAWYAPFMRGNGDFPKLSELVKERLNRDIQISGQFHCCEEDAVAALDLYKSVWHEWESVSPKRQQTQKSPTGQRSKTSYAERRERKERKRKNKKKEVKKLRKLRQGSHCNSHLVRYNSHYLSTVRRILVSSLSTILVIPKQFSPRVMHGIIRHATASKTSKKSRRKSKKKKKSGHFQLWFKKNRPLCDGFFLVSHCLLEMWCIILSCVGCTPTAHWDATSFHSANGAFIAGLLGMKLFRMGKCRDQSFFGILAQYRVVSSLLRMASCLGMLGDLAMPAVEERTRLTQRMVSVITGQIMLATPSAIAFPVQSHVGANAGLFSYHFSPIIQIGGTAFRSIGGASSQEFLPLAWDVVLSCWFVLRYAKKL